MNTVDDFDYDYMKFKYGKQDIDDVFATMIDTYHNVSSPKVVDQINLWELLQSIRYNFINISATNIMFTPKYVDGIRNKAYDVIKVKLPAVTYNGNFNKYKEEKNLIHPTNLMFLDIDDFKTKAEAQAYKQRIISKYDWIVSCSLSPSRIGLHVIIKVDKIADNDDFNAKYDFISQEYFDGVLDIHGKSITRFTIIPFDNNIYINESPSVLNIDKIISDVQLNTIPKGSVEKNTKQKVDKGIRSVYKKERAICTAYTNSNESNLKIILNEAASKDGLKFTERMDETQFEDPNVPFYIREGLDVIRINLFPYQYKKVTKGNRTNTLGALSMQLISLNAHTPEEATPELRKSITDWTLSINIEICEPPLPIREVMNTLKSNWKKFDAGELDCSEYMIKQRSFWSQECTLNGNEKRKVTCRIKNEPIVNETKRLIAEAIESIIGTGEKLTQTNVSKISGLALPTVKKYREYFHEQLKVLGYDKQQKHRKKPSIHAGHNEFDETEEVVNQVESAYQLDSVIPATDDEYSSQTAVPLIPEAITYLPEIHDDKDELAEITDDMIHQSFQRIFGGFAGKISGNDFEELKARYHENLSILTYDELKLLTLSSGDIEDATSFFKQGSLDDKLRYQCAEFLCLNS